MKRFTNIKRACLAIAAIFALFMAGMPATATQPVVMSPASASDDGPEVEWAEMTCLVDGVTPYGPSFRLSPDNEVETRDIDIYVSVEGYGAQKSAMLDRWGFYKPGNTYIFANSEIESAIWHLVDDPYEYDGLFFFIFEVEGETTNGSWMDLRSFGCYDDIVTLPHTASFGDVKCDVDQPMIQAAVTPPVWEDDLLMTVDGHAVLPGYDPVDGSVTVDVFDVEDTDGDGFARVELFDYYSSIGFREYAVEELCLNNPPALEDITVGVNLGDDPFLFELNGSDKDGDELKYSIEQPANGTLEQLGTSEQFSFTSDSRGESVVESSVSDGTETTTATATFQVTEVVTPLEPNFDSSTGELTVPSQDGVVYHVNGDPYPPDTPFQVCGQATVESYGVQWVELSGTASWNYVYDCNEEPVPPGLEVLRWGGADRYGTAAIFADNGWGTGGVVYVTTGRNGADALAASGASTGTGSGLTATTDGPPVLLVRQNQLPSVTAEALDRLAPSGIVVLGSEAAVSTGVEQQLRAWAPVSRIGGADRYETAALVALQSERDVIYLATGQEVAFADALSAASLARSTGGAILLAKQDVLPDATGEALAELRPGRVVVVGGSDRVSDSVAQAAAEAAGLTTFERVAGPNRYDTSQEVAKQFSADVPTPSVYVATGTAFPDALTAGALAGNEGAPVLLTRPVELPEGFVDALQRREPEERIVIAGSPAAVSTGVEQQLRAWAGLPSLP